MRMSKLLMKTEKEVASEAQLPSHRLLLRAGLIKQVSAGIYSLTPIAQRIIQRISQIAREEMNGIGGQEVLLPLTQPASLWQESGRLNTIDSSLARWQDRNGQDMVLAMTHEEAVTDLVRHYVQSYRQLPLMVYQIQTKYRDEARPRAGLIRLREFLMKDAYSFHADSSSLETFYQQVLEAYQSFYERCGVDALVVESDTGMMGGGGAHEFMVVADGGEDTLLICRNCGYAANREVAVAKKQITKSEKTVPAITKVHTPSVPSIDRLSTYLGVSADTIMKCVLYTTSDQRAVLACVPGDREVNEMKLQKLLAVEDIHTMTPDEVERFKFAVGYVSPVGSNLRDNVLVVTDESIASSESGWIAGANESDYHYANVVYGRDFSATFTGDIMNVRDGDTCSRCQSVLESVRGIEVGNIFKLGTKYSQPMKAVFTTKEGNVQPLVMGCYGIGITRMLACIVEANHDMNGMIWPESVAPFLVHLVLVGTDEETVQIADDVYKKLGVESVLYDDREVSAGVKFMDADLLGMPLRVTVSKKSLTAGGIEVRNRKTGETRILPIQEINVGTLREAVQ